MILDADDPSEVIARTEQPLLVPETADERSGTVPNVVFPTAIEEIDGVRYVFYGMADAKIGVARLERLRSAGPARAGRLGSSAPVASARFLAGRRQRPARRPDSRRSPTSTPTRAGRLALRPAACRTLAGNDLLADPDVARRRDHHATPAATPRWPSPP